MEYYFLKEKIDSIETGKAFPAVKSYDDYDFNKSNSVYILNQSNFPEIIPDIQFRLSEDSNWCDVLSQATIASPGLLISEQLKLLINEIPNKSKSRFYPAQITKGSRIETYYWWKIVDKERVERIDFEKTIFKYKVTKEDELNFHCEDYLEYKLKQEELGFFNPLKTDKLHLKYNNKSIFLHPLNSKITVDKEIANHLKKMTGIEIINL